MAARRTLRQMVVLVFIFSPWLSNRQGSNGLGTARANSAVSPNLHNTKSLLPSPALTVSGEELAVAQLGVDLTLCTKSRPWAFTTAKNSICGGELLSSINSSSCL